MHYYSPNYKAVLLSAEIPEFPEMEDLGNIEQSSDLIEINELETWYLKFYDKNKIPLELEHQKDYLQEKDKLNKFFERLSDNVFRINFKNYVGLSRFAGFQIRVINTKISEDQFDAMLHELCDEYANLIFSFQQTVGSSGCKEKSGNDPLYLQILFIKHFLLNSSPNLQHIAELICRNPHHRLQAIRQTTPVELARQIDLTSIVTLFSNSSALAELRPGHSLENSSIARRTAALSGRHLFPIELAECHRRVDHDTPENRFIKFFIGDLLSRLRQFNVKKSFLNPELQDDLKMLVQELEHFSQNPLWQTVGNLQHIPSHSMVLQKRDGYSHLFKLYSLLQLATRYTCSAFRFDRLIELKDVPKLYEYWCFFQVKRAIERVLSQRQPKTITWFNHQEETVLEAGLWLDYGDNIGLYYDKDCRGSDPGQLAPDGLSGYSSLKLRPDIMICQGSRKLILDAKYKIDKNKDDAKSDDLIKMHAYRDAINNVWGAYALYPGQKADKLEKYPCFGEADTSYKGIGAIALTPGNYQQELDTLIQVFLS
ncbi:DUF2357 domain-containing protein [Candidatus Methylobacter oryzae]|uniref:DUF2357 domain-containing protein n=1 Tax=Candidatus Methylobacter oryzae TaxID=2497749 RepID=A0ABY3CAV2_9GAMM|nr:DUF2357 domain-containing protein [Candidatus Methylobacter oryzae]TRW95824.1 DUF2357 domain-containing protein [Candidatus Methylobacter oryzae]